MSCGARLPPRSCRSERCVSGAIMNAGIMNFTAFAEPKESNKTVKAEGEKGRTAAWRGRAGQSCTTDRPSVIGLTDLSASSKDAVHGQLLNTQLTP